MDAMDDAGQAFGDPNHAKQGTGHCRRTHLPPHRSCIANAATMPLQDPGVLLLNCAEVRRGSVVHASTVGCNNDRKMQRVRTHTRVLAH
eukprot:5010230-Prorocentrum_lima.AAC.1